MSAILLLVALALTGQTALDSSRYPLTNSPPAGAGDSQKATAPAATGTPIGSSPITTAPGAQSPYNSDRSTYSSGTNTPTGGARSPLGAAGQGYSPLSTQPASSGVQPLSQGTPISSGQPIVGRGAIGSGANLPGELSPQAMMRAMLARRPDSRLSGDWVTLDDVVAGATSRADQTQRIEAYWDLCSSVADYFLGLREQEEMPRLRQVIGRNSPTLDAAEKDLAVRVSTAERGARAAQLRLAGITGRGADRLPLPAQSPHCGNYSTRHEQVFAGRSSREAEELSQLIPLRHAELDDAAAAVTRSEKWLEDVTASRASAGDETSLLRALELLALERRAFVQIARDYNRRIARYVELAAPGQVDPDRLISMLIKREQTATATRSSSGAPPANRNSQTDGVRPTLAGGAGGWMAADAAADTETSAARRDSEVTPVSGEAPATEQGERSVLVPAR